MDKAGYGFEMKNRTKIMLGDMFDKALQDHFVRKNPAKSIKIKILWIRLKILHHIVSDIHLQQGRLNRE